MFFLEYQHFTIFCCNIFKFREIFIKIQSKNDEIRLKNQQNLWNFTENHTKSFGKILQNFWIWSGAKECRSCRARKMLKNAPTLAIVAVHTEENEPSRVLIRNTNIEYRWYLYSLFYTQIFFLRIVSDYIWLYLSGTRLDLRTRALFQDSCVEISWKASGDVGQEQTVHLTTTAA